jgi:uncharacterized repeat protein (TIGR03803 family)
MSSLINSKTPISAVGASFQAIALACALFLTLAAAPLHAQSFTDLYNFNCASGGCEPYDLGQLVQWTDGNLYGTTVSGGASGDGSIFMVTPNGTYTDLLDFDGTNGSGPNGSLALASDGNFYGTAVAGGSHGYGTLFRFTPPSTLTVLHNFSNGADGARPMVPPVQAADGNLYGVTFANTTYRLTLPAGKFQPLPNPTPAETTGPLILASDGNLYGTSQDGGTDNSGTVYRMTTAGAIDIIYNFTFDGATGSNPAGPLTQAPDGFLYGTTLYGGANDSGGVFQMSLSGSTSELHSFDQPVSCSAGYCNNDGGFPYAGVLAAADGNLYGVTEDFGANDKGTIFEVSTSGSFTKLFDFTGSAGVAEGWLPLNTLMQHTNGCIYGVASEGGFAAGGDFFSVCPSSVIQIVRVEGPVWVRPIDKVTLLANNLGEAVSVAFAGQPATFQPGSDTYLTAQVPAAAVDGPITIMLTNPAGGEQQIQTLESVHILPMITNLDPSSGAPGTEVGIVGGGFNGATKVTFGGVKATTFRVVTPTLIQAWVPARAKTGRVAVTTPNGHAASQQTFTVN